MDSKTKKVANIGFIAKGTVYAITGILALLAAFNLGGQKAGKMEVLDFLEKQPFGKVILGLLGLGLICYAIWRFIQSVQDPEGIGSDFKGMAKRVSFFISGLFYLGFGLYAWVEIFKNSSGGGSSIFSGDKGQLLLIVVGLGLAIKSLYQFIKAYKGDFLEKFNISAISDSSKRAAIKNLGYAGLISRGIVVGIVCYFFLKAGLGSGGSPEGTGQAFSFIQQNTSSPWLVGLVALGLICYGVYMFAHTKYRKFQN